MKKSFILHCAAIACKLACVLLVFTLLWITGIMIYGKLDSRVNVQTHKGSAPSSRAGSVFYLTFLDTKGYSDASFHIARRSSWTTADRPNEDPFAFRNISSISLMLNYLQVVTLVFCGFHVLKTFLVVINSVKLSQSFKRDNTVAFRKMGKFLFIIFLLTSYKIILAERGQFYGFYLNITPLGLSLIAFVIAEIFKEGNKLSEENTLTI